MIVSPHPPDKTAKRITPHRKIWYYCLAAGLLLGILISLIILLPEVRQFIILAIEQKVLNRELQSPQIWIQKLFYFSLAAIPSIILIGFLFLTSPGRKLANKIELESKIANQVYFSKEKLVEIISSEKFFTVFCLLSGFLVFSMAFFRAANTGITHDEAFTYLYYVLPNIYDSFIRNPILNNHLLNSFCIRAVNFFSQSGYNELLIRFPNLIFYCIYLYFSFLIAKQYKNRFFIYILFISNYYLNEFFGLARGYGMACACINAACYFFEKWKISHINKRADNYHFLCFMLFCSTGALSNSITLYIILSFLLIINFKYRKDLLKLSYVPFYIIFFLSALYPILFSNRGGEDVYSTYSIISSIMSLPNMFSNSRYPSFMIAVLSFLSFIYLSIKTRAKNDYCLILAIFFIVCIVSQIIFNRGYPVMREMIPLYPVFVIIMANTLEYIPNWNIKKPLFLVCTIALCLQFYLKIDTKSTRDWNDNYSIRDMVYSYIASNDIIANREEFQSFIEENQESSGSFPVFIFYTVKAELFLKDRIEK